MSKIKPVLFVHSPFYEALSGEFSVADDSQKKIHTLGRLANATFRKGTRHMMTRREVEYVYTPSWSPGVSVELRGNTIRGDRSILKMSGLALCADNDSALTFSDVDVSNTGGSLPPAIQVMHDIDEGIAMFLEDDADVSRARGKIAGFAAEFFNQAAFNNRQ